MSTYQVTSQPFALFADGLQESVIISNDGPSTLYLDEFSSISDSSYAIPVTGTIVWDSMRPLWVMSKGDRSTVRVTRNGQIKVDNSDRFFTIYSNPNFYDGSSPGSLLPLSDSLEVSAFRSIVLHFAETVSRAQAFAETIKVTAYWYDEDGNNLTTDFLEGFRANNVGVGQGVRVTLPVRGFSVKFGITPNSAVATRGLEFRVIGTTKDAYFAWDSMTRLACINTGSAGTVTTKTGFWAEDAYPWTGARLLNGLSSKLRIRLRHSTASTASGNIRVENADGVIIDQLDIPSGSAAGTGYQMDITVPPTMPLRFVSTTPTGGGTAQLSISFQDYDY